MKRLAWQPDDWRARGACQNADPDVFFPVSDGGASASAIRMAKSICAGCPVNSACRGYALEHREIQGIWGGMTDEERRRLRRSRGAGQPARSASTAA